MLTYLNPPELGDTSAFGVSHGVATDSLVFVSGLALDTQTMKLRTDAETVADEVNICWNNIGVQLAMVGLTIADVVKTTCYLSSEQDRGEFIQADRAALAPWGPFPARETFVLGIASNLRVLIEAVAIRPEHS